MPLYWWGGGDGRWHVRARIALRLRRPTLHNFGDWLAPQIVARLAGRRVRYSEGQDKLLALGSVLFAAREGDMVWGSGMLNAGNLASLRRIRRLTIHAVRGPRTRAHLLSAGFDCPPVLGDPAILLPLLYAPAPSIAGRIGIVPHYSHLDYVRGLALDSSVLLIDPTRPWPEVLRQITSCDVVLSSSLHGLIVAEAYGVPARMLVIGRPLHDDLLKFEDYFESTDRHCAFDRCTDGIDLRGCVESALLAERPKFPVAALLRAFPWRGPAALGPGDLVRQDLPGVGRALDDGSRREPVVPGDVEPATPANRAAGSRWNARR